MLGAVGVVAESRGPPVCLGFRQVPQSRSASMRVRNRLRVHTRGVREGVRAGETHIFQHRKLDEITQCMRRGRSEAVEARPRHKQWRHRRAWGPGEQGELPWKQPTPVLCTLHTLLTP